jgi:hypothetical protein
LQIADLQNANINLQSANIILSAQTDTLRNDKTSQLIQITALNQQIKALQNSLSLCNGDATAIKTLAIESLPAYPNPTTGIVYIDNPDGEEAEVYTIDGSLLLRSKAATIIDLSKYAGGAYIIKVGNKAAKVVKE